MMRLSIIRTHSAPGKRSHPTLFVNASSWSLFVWMHTPARPWRARDRGMLCLGLGIMSFNFFHRSFYQ